MEERARISLWGTHSQSYDRLQWYGESDGKQSWYFAYVSSTTLFFHITMFSYMSLILISYFGISLIVQCFVILDSNRGRFQRLFICFRCYEGLTKHCRPLLFLDGTHCKNRYMRNLLAATGINGNGGMFPLAFVIVSTENKTNWTWFMTCLRDIFYTIDDPYLLIDERVLISDSDKGLNRAVVSLILIIPSV